MHLCLVCKVKKKKPSPFLISKDRLLLEKEKKEVLGPEISNPFFRIYDFGKSCPKLDF